MDYIPIHTACTECGQDIVLDIQDADGLMGGECANCGHYDTDYPDGFWQV